MSYLSDSAVEAMTSAIAGVGPDQPLESYAVAAFDALLDFLGVHIEEWEIAIHDVAEAAREKGDEIDYLQAVVVALQYQIDETSR